ncbi:acyl-CoA N-acyltransferase [Sordaria brevicollis]|uniref:N-alpha-acetyltransferase 40 n=1 Tax=Sordaria brevicollis TaxID=83679 RepID=A0AAE0U5D6_SORBR|nr:acyl-CoA N-acyltransferase [Sordaria brevicollis]
MAPKRQRAPTSPIERANRKTDEQFISDYLQPFISSKLLHSPPSSSPTQQPPPPVPKPWTTEWTHPKTSHKYSISLVSSGKLSPEELKACFDLVKETSYDDYQNSKSKWQPRKKMEEMKSPELRYILVKDTSTESGSIRAFTSLMPTYEEGQPVVYCYEIHLKPELQGSGLGSLLVGFHVIVAANLPPITKVMLTCFLSNKRALGFYKKHGFEKDGISPGPRKFRSGKVVMPDYAIMSRPVTRSAPGSEENAFKEQPSETKPEKKEASENKPSQEEPSGEKPSQEIPTEKASKEKSNEDSPSDEKPPEHKRCSQPR